MIVVTPQILIINGQTQHKSTFITQARKTPKHATLNNIQHTKQNTDKLHTKQTT